MDDLIAVPTTEAVWMVSLDCWHIQVSYHELLVGALLSCIKCWDDAQPGCPSTAVFRTVLACKRKRRYGMRWSRYG